MSNGMSNSMSSSGAYGRIYDRLPSYALLQRQQHNLEQLERNFFIHRTQWRASGVVLKELRKSPQAFNDHLASVGLKRKTRRGILGLFRPRFLLRLGFWSGVSLGTLEITKKSNKLSWQLEVIAGHAQSFFLRRVVSPMKSIVNDVVFNRRTSITDREALQDAKRSLKAMIYDFLCKHQKKSMSDSERRRIAAEMDMSPISEEYEKELRRPLQSIVSGKIARCVLIQLQFVKKELLVAMQAIDDLFNANQVNMQLLAITPAVLSIFSLQIASRTLITALRATSRGRKVESSTAIHKELREGLRNIERLLYLSDGFNSGNKSIDVYTLGRLMSMLHRMHNTLVSHSSFFESGVLMQLQEDLRDLILPHLSVKQRLAIVERIARAYPFMQYSPRQSRLW